MAPFVLRRVFLILVTVLGAMTFTFFLANVIPSDPARAALGPDATEAQVQSYRVERGLDQPAIVQYFRYLGSIAQADFGRSIVTRTAIIDDFRQFVPATIELFIPALLFSVIVGVGLGIVSALYRGSWIDQLSRFISLVGLSTPVFWLGIVLQIVFFSRLGWFPVGGRLSAAETPPPTVTGLYTIDSLLAGDLPLFLSALHHLVMPSFVLSMITLGIVTRMTRSSLVDVLSSDYIRTARSKGLNRSTIVVKHGLRNALIPIVTVIGVRVGQMFGGAVLTETVFSWPGIGRYAFTGLKQLDIPLVLAFAIFSTFVYAIVNFVVDLAYGAIDPRVEFK